MIISKEPVSMSEAVGYIKDEEKLGKETKIFIKKFAKLNPKEAKELKEKLKALDLIKLREEHIMGIIDLLPEDDEDLNKICVGVGLNEDETKKILDTVKEFI